MYILHYILYCYPCYDLHAYRNTVFGEWIGVPEGVLKFIYFDLCSNQVIAY